LKLTVVSITSQSLFDADYIGCCDNCGKIICNIASVKDESGKCYEIGLDCKKTLIDKKQKILDALDWQGKHYVISGLDGTGTKQLCFDILDKIEAEAEDSSCPTP
ncbi:MAG: hypothetical protein COB38_13355, partial [Gammaproteobacteria bacterium]